MLDDLGCISQRLRVPPNASLFRAGACLTELLLGEPDVRIGSGLDLAHTDAQTQVLLDPLRVLGVLDLAGLPLVSLKSQESFEDLGSFVRCHYPPLLLRPLFVLHDGLLEDSLCRLIGSVQLGQHLLLVLRGFVNEDALSSNGLAFVSLLILLLLGRSGGTALGWPASVGKLFKVGQHLDLVAFEVAALPEWRYCVRVLEQTVLEQADAHRVETAIVGAAARGLILLRYLLLGLLRRTVGEVRFTDIVDQDLRLR